MPDENTNNEQTTGVTYDELAAELQEVMKFAPDVATVSETMEFLGIE